MKKIDESIICAGFGGQGIMLIGKILADSAMIDKYHTTWMPSYGAEVRGGTAHSMIRISTDTISSPLVAAPDSVIVMNKPSFIKFIGKIKKKGLAICNSSIIDAKSGRKDLKVINIPATEIANGLGNSKVANMVALGAYAKVKNILSTKSLIKAIEEAFANKEELVSINKEAFKKGMEFV